MNINKVFEFLNDRNIWNKIEGNYIRTRRLRIRIPKINNRMAYLAGALTGDGTITTCKRKKGGYHLLVRLCGTEEKLVRAKILFQNLFGYLPKIQKDKRKRNCYYININSAAIFAYFSLLGLPIKKKRNIVVPPIISANPLLFKDYMLGLIETDGHVNKYGKVQLKQRDENFLKEIVELLNKNLRVISNPPRVNYTEGKPYYYIRFPIEQIHLNHNPDLREKLV